MRGYEKCRENIGKGPPADFALGRYPIQPKFNSKASTGTGNLNHGPIKTSQSYYHFVLSGSARRKTSKSVATGGKGCSVGHRFSEVLKVPTSPGKFKVFALHREVEIATSTSN